VPQSPSFVKECDGQARLPCHITFACSKESGSKDQACILQRSTFMLKLAADGLAWSLAGHIDKLIFIHSQKIDRTAFSAEARRRYRRWPRHQLAQVLLPGEILSRIPLRSW